MAALIASLLGSFLPFLIQLILSIFLGGATGTS